MVFERGQLMKSLLIASVLICSSGAFGQQLEDLEVKPEHSAVPYDRGLYKHWSDFDEDGQDTRQEVLIIENIGTLVMDGNKVESGLWFGKYCGFITDDPSDLQIDHMVPLGEAHRSGASEWTKKKREAYANDLTDPRALIAVKGGCNGSKRDRDPSDWLPPNRTFWCEYLSEWIAVKIKWGLSIDQDEHDAIKKGQKVCSKYKSGDKLEGRH